VCDQIGSVMIHHPKAEHSERPNGCLSFVLRVVEMHVLLKQAAKKLALSKLTEEK